ncbi:aromatic ring-hydroxylating dioxygenase subunit alpha [Leeia sp. TBRC 13508]|uniref:Aromatic ring-hydroxylating dioxygenase subunit alpha n=1 Tax=Leeia speluncae TaxID=2884804 RepID=A0ABS8D1R0_9NEIS|nr:aromatic ring-hydroxylating dioxygenase subunit alpha [Leeia speluncae]MCB6182138.1 aromatic ring-hydroxylating dioxygenase subunit alpha [Leeia speluncae]
MSDLAHAAQLQAFGTQLPVYTYFDAEFYQQELTHLFANAPVYYGHHSMVPNPGDYYTLPWMDHGKMLVRKDETNVSLLSNVCRHRQAVMLKGRGNGPNIVCPVHRWTYDNAGELLGAPHFPQNPCMNLGKTDLQTWNGLLFDARRDVAKDLAQLGCKAELDLSDFHFNRVELTEYNFNWKTFIEVYLEDYHVDPFHPGLGQFVNCADLKWEFGENYSVQTVGPKNGLAKPGSSVYQKWSEQALAANGGEVPPYGAIWLTYYPNIMVEWYPHTLVVSTVLPRGADKCTVLTEFYYPEEIALFEPELIEAEQAAYFETAEEDDDICYRMHEGRKALYLRGDNEVGPYQSPTEDGMRHFHEWMRCKMGELIKD